MSEDWRTLPASRGYEISSFGRVRRNGRLVKGSVNKTGYRVFDIYFARGHRSRRACHQLVCDVFIGPRPSDQECRHLNGNRLDNRLENLRYGTRKENMRDQYLHGTRVSGERHPHAKLSYEKAAEIREKYARGSSHRILAIEYGVAKGAIQAILAGRTWTALVIEHHVDTAPRGLK